MFHPGIAWAYGLPITLGLLSGPVSDQMFYQRAVAVKARDIVKVFVRGGLIFGLVLITLSLLGFVAVSQGIKIDDPQMVSPVVIATLLPDAALYLFILMAFAGLCSTMDSAFCGVSLLGSIDIYKRYKNKNTDDEMLLKTARQFMFGCALAGGAIALLKPQLLWVFFIYGMMTSCAFIPTLMAIFWDRVTAKDVFVGIVTSLVIATPICVYANIAGDENLLGLSSLFSVGLSGLVCWLSGMMNPITAKLNGVPST